jgi:hypothetical protein
MLPHLLQSIRSRPRHERRILAITTYLAATALVIVLWSLSFANSFNQGADEVVEPKGTATETTSPADQDQSKNLTSPFEALTQSIGGLIDGFRSVSSATHDLAMSIEHASEATTSAPEVLATQDESQPLPPPIPAVVPKIVNNPVQSKKESLSQIASRSFKAEDYDRVLAEKITHFTEPPRHEQDSGLIASLQSHAHTLLQTITNAYNAIRE